MVEIINQNITGGIAGRRAGNVKGVVIHNDYGAMSAKEYIAWLKRRKNAGQLDLGFAHYYIDRNTIVRVEDTYNGAWATANKDGNMNYISSEVVQSFYGVLTTEQFKENEAMVFRQAAEDLQFYKLPINRNTVRLHREFSSTSCPHRSADLHGKVINAVKDYFISQIKYYASKGKTVQEMLRSESAEKVVVNTNNPFNVKATDTVMLNQTRALYWADRGSKAKEPFSKNDFHKYWRIKSFDEKTGVANIFSSRDGKDGGWAVLHDLIPTNLDNPNNVVLTDTVYLNGRAKYWADKGAKAKQDFTAADKKKAWKIKSIQTDSTANIYNVENEKDGGWAVLHDLSYK